MPAVGPDTADYLRAGWILLEYCGCAHQIWCKMQAHRWGTGTLRCRRQVFKTKSRDRCRVRSQAWVNFRQSIEVPNQDAEHKVRTQASVSNGRSGYNRFMKKAMSSTEQKNTGQEIGPKS